MRKKLLRRFYSSKSPEYKHLLRSMRISFVLLFTCVICSLANEVNSQNLEVTINERNIELKEAISIIEEQTGYMLFTIRR
jgi:hypothetical protein